MAGPPQTGYTPQIAPGGSANFGGASPDAFGAGVGAQIGRLGGTLEEANLQARRLELERQKELEATDAAARISELGGHMDGIVAEAKANPAPGGAGHTATTLAEFDRQSETVLGAVTNEHVRRETQLRLSEMRARLQGDGETFEAGARVAQRFGNADRTTNTAQQRIGATADPNVLFEELANLDMLGAGLGGDPAKREEYLAGKRSAYWETFVETTARTDPLKAREILSSGAAQDYLSPRATRALNDRVDVLVHRQEIEARAQQTVIVHQEQEEEATYRANAGKGVQVDPAQGEALAARAEARGDTSGAVELRAAAAGSQAASAYSGPNVLPAQITGRLAEIEGTPHWQQDLHLVVERNALLGLRNDRRNAEPNIPPPVLTDARDIARFEQQVEADARSRGVPPQYVFGDMKRLFDGYMKEGGQGQRQVLDAIGHFSQHAAFEAARQVAPQDGVFQMAATLHGDAREWALDGRGALAGQTGNDKLITPEAMNAQLDRLDGALVGGDPDFAKAAKETALAIAAQLHRQQGKTRFDAGLADEAVRLTLGGLQRGSQKTGGLGEVNGHPIVLPDDMTQDEFDQRYYRLAGPSKAFGSGRPLSFETLRRSYRLVNSGDGDYQWRDAFGRAVTDDKGNVVTLHIRHVNPPPPVRPEKKAPFVGMPAMR